MRVWVVLPAFNAARTLEATVAALPAVCRDNVLLVDDGSDDETVRIARRLGLPVVVHECNRGYGANQKTCYTEALHRGADVVVMVHPDNQYDTSCISEMVALVQAGAADMVLGSRMLAGDPRASGMPGWRYYGNVVLTICENRVFGLELSEYHTGLRAFSARLLSRIRYTESSDGFLFDQQIVAQAVAGGFRIAEVPARCRYFPEASSISFPRAVQYGLGSLWILRQYRQYRRNPRASSYLAPLEAPGAVEPRDM